MFVCARSGNPRQHSETKGMDFTHTSLVTVVRLNFHFGDDLSL